MDTRHVRYGHTARPLGTHGTSAGDTRHVRWGHTARPMRTHGTSAGREVVSLEAGQTRREEGRDVEPKVTTPEGKEGLGEH
jgi:hypothetical protein